jgi:hypothetical protein
VGWPQPLVTAPCHLHLRLRLSLRQAGAMRSGSLRHARLPYNSIYEKDGPATRSRICHWVLLRRSQGCRWSLGRILGTRRRTSTSPRRTTMSRWPPSVPKTLVLGFSFPCFFILCIR